MNEREIRIHLYGAIGDEAAKESEWVATHDPESGRMWFTSVRQAQMATRCAQLSARPLTADVGS